MFEWPPSSSPKTAESSISKLLLGWFRDDPPEELYFPGCPDPRYLTNSDDDTDSDPLSLTPDGSLNTSPKDTKPNTSTTLSSVRLFTTCSSRDSFPEHSSSYSSSEHDGLLSSPDYADLLSSSDYANLLSGTDDEAVLQNEGNNPANFRVYAQRVENVINRLPGFPQDIGVTIDHERISFFFVEELQTENHLLTLINLFSEIGNCTPPGNDLLNEFKLPTAINMLSTHSTLHQLR